MYPPAGVSPGRRWVSIFDAFSYSPPRREGFFDADTKCISPPRSHQGAKRVRPIASTMDTRASIPDHKALTNTTHDGSTKAPALQSLYSLDQDALNSRVSDRNNNKTDDRAAKARAPTFLSIKNPTIVLCSLPITTMACHHSNAPSSGFFPRSSRLVTPNTNHTWVNLI